MMHNLYGRLVTPDGRELEAMLSISCLLDVRDRLEWYGGSGILIPYEEGRALELGPGYEVRNPDGPYPPVLKVWLTRVTAAAELTRNLRGEWVMVPKPIEIEFRTTGGEG